MSPLVAGLTIVNAGLVESERSGGVKASVKDQAIFPLTRVRNHIIWEDLEAVWRWVPVSPPRSSEPIGRWQKTGVGAALGGCPGLSSEG